MAKPLCNNVLLDISSFDIFGKRIVSIIPKRKTKNGCIPFTIQMSVTGASIVA